MTFIDYINEFQSAGKSGQVQSLVNAIGVDEAMLRTLMEQHVTEANINEFGRLDALKGTCDMNAAKRYFEEREGEKIPPFKVAMKLDALLREFVLTGGFDLE